MDFSKDFRILYNNEMITNLQQLQISFNPSVVAENKVTIVYAKMGYEQPFIVTVPLAAVKFEQVPEGI